MSCARLTHVLFAYHPVPQYSLAVTIVPWCASKCKNSGLTIRCRSIFITPLFVSIVDTKIGAAPYVDGFTVYMIAALASVETKYYKRTRQKRGKMCFLRANNLAR